ncbi:hypothetical protein WFZ85_12725 [Flavobacterium sp. j3]|uniref:Uncharacterized protein n=1 Tax=Flavobacterium aureirubrum TaxID=3133147 RepID=A0ABU9N9C6_9FLAO
MEILKDKKSFEKLFKDKYQKDSQISLFDDDFNIDPDLLADNKLSDFNAKNK